jgi:hypothetical protein
MKLIISALTLLLASPTATAQDWTPTAEQTAVYKALGARDPVPCAEVEALASDPLDALRTVVEHASMPPWAPMRAAHCIATRHAEAARADLLAWVSDEQTRGLALQLLGELDEVDPAVAVDVARAALAGPIADDARARLADSDLAELRALVAE